MSGRGGASECVLKRALGLLVSALRASSQGLRPALFDSRIHFDPALEHASNVKQGFEVLQRVALDDKNVGVSARFQNPDLVRLAAEAPA